MVRPTWVALLRGVNVGGRGRLAMADLRAAAADLGWTGCRTLGASGNLVFAADGCPEDHSAALERALPGVRVLVLPRDDFLRAVDRCPWADDEGKAVHGFFLWTDAMIDWPLLEKLKTETEDLRLDGRTAWLRAPQGIGRSRLGAAIERVVRGSEMTGRNLSTIRKLVEMVDGTPTA